MAPVRRWRATAGTSAQGRGGQEPRREPPRS
jgi:hypothetical protein